MYLLFFFYYQAKFRATLSGTGCHSNQERVLISTVNQIRQRQQTTGLNIKQIHRYIYNISTDIFKYLPFKSFIQLCNVIAELNNCLVLSIKS